MPVKRRLEKQRRGECSDVEWSVLADVPPPPEDTTNGIDFYLCCYHRRSGDINIAVPPIEDLWRMHGAEIVADWIAAHPGTRPLCWWEYDAPRHEGLRYTPELRIQVAGSGIPEPLRSENVKLEAFDIVYGIPTCWDEVDFDISPPAFEAEAVYLRRHGLLAPGELRRLKPADFEPEVLHRVIYTHLGTRIFTSKRRPHGA